MNEITNDQNRDDRLDLLRAQRTYYRRAKRLQTAFLVLALILPWIGVFWGANHPDVRPLLALGSIALLLLEIGLATGYTKIQQMKHEWILVSSKSEVDENWADWLCLRCGQQVITHSESNPNTDEWHNKCGCDEQIVKDVMES